jgi:hypothetical protein
MKKILQMIFLPLTVAAYGQQPVTTTVKLHLQDCKDKMAHWHSADTLILHKLPEGTVVRKIVAPSRMGKHTIKMQDLPISEYRLTFTNNFEQTVSKQINIKGEPFQTVYVCLDSLQAYSRNTLAQLQLGDSLVVYYTSIGCYHWAEEKMVLLKTSSGFLAKLYDENGHTVVAKGRRNKPASPILLNTTVLNDKQAAAFVRFENELGWVRPGGCTTSDNYRVESKYGRTEKDDGTCEWWGFDFLKKTFFGKQP